MFQVFDNGLPADCHHHKVHSSWNNSRFSNYEDALIYARKWIAPFGASYDGLDGVVLQINVPYDYSGYGDLIEIRAERGPAASTD